MSFSLRLFGGAALDGQGGRVTGPAAQRHRMALMALLATAHPRSLAREKVMALLWPESDTEHARRLLNQAVHVLRRALGAEAILTVAEEVELNAGRVACDVTQFEEAFAGGDYARCAALYVGPFLDGFLLDEAPEFAEWAARERTRLVGMYAQAAERLAEAAEAQGAAADAVRWWKARADIDAFDSRIMLRLMLALEAAGNRPGALLEAAAHQKRLQSELGIAPHREVLDLAERLRTAPPAPILLVPPPLPAAPAPAREAPARRHRYAVAAVVLLTVVVGGVLLASRRAAPPTGPASVAPAPVDEIARAVARELGRRQRGDTLSAAAVRRTRSIPAYELYLRGSDPRLLRSDSAARQGLEYFRRAVALDSNYAAAWAGLARMTLRVGVDGPPDLRRSSLRDGEAAALRALALDDSLAEAHAALGLVRVQQRRLAEAESHLTRAVALEPSTARNHEYLVRLYIWWGRPEEALAEARKALAADPLAPSATAELGRALVALDRCDEALAELDKLRGLDPPLQRVAGLTAQCYARQKQWDKALEALRPQAERGAAQSVGLYGFLLASAGHEDSAGRMLARLTAEEARIGGQEFNVAMINAGLGHRSEVVRWLNRAVDDDALLPFEEGAPMLLRWLDRNRSDAGVAALWSRLGLQKR